jgi:hypothetical protein
VEGGRSLSLIRDAVTFVNLSEGTEEREENLTQNSRCLEQDMNQSPSECKSEAFQLDPASSSMDAATQY